MSTPAQTVTVSDLIPDLAAQSPAVSSNAKTDAAGSPPVAAVTDQDAPAAPESHGETTAATVASDSAGVPFDPARHLTKPHPKTGRWMPRGGRKPKSAPGAPVSSSGSTSSTPPAPSGSSPASTSQDDDIPEIGPDDSPEDGGDGSAGSAGTGAGAGARPEGPARDAELSPKAAGELAARALYKVTGALSGDHKRAVAKGAEHESIKQTAAAYFEFRGLKIVGLLALGATVLAYLLTDDRSDGIAKRFGDWWRERRAKAKPASSAVIDIHPAAPASAKPNRDPQPPPEASPFSGRGL